MNIDDYDFMLAKKGNKNRVKNDNWIYQLKADGMRVFLISDDSGTKLINRGRNDITNRFPEVLKEFDDNFILDTELIVPTEKKPLGELNEINKRNTDNKMKIKHYSNKKPAFILIFDILDYKSEDLRNYPLSERRKYLQFIPKKENYRIMPQFENFTKLWEKVKNNKYEGIMAKKKNGSYVGKRSNSWLKVKNWEDLETEAKDYEEHDKGILLYTKEGYKVNVNGHLSNKIKEMIDNKGEVKIEVGYLEKTKKGNIRNPHIKRVLN